MEVLGVGPTELILIIVVALIVLGPKDLAKTGKTIGKWLNDLIHSDTWRAVQKTSKELRQLPTQLMREDNLERFLTEKNNSPESGTNAGTWSGKVGTGNPPPPADPAAAAKNEPTIHPPVTVEGPPASTLESPPPKSTPKAAAKPRKKATSTSKKKTAPKKKSTTRKKSNE